jgi:hypothetical protein
MELWELLQQSNSEKPFTMYSNWKIQRERARKVNKVSLYRVVLSAHTHTHAHTTKVL